MRFLQRTWRGMVLAVVVVTLSGVARAGETAPQSVKLLAIGNSFSGNATRYLPGLATAGGDTLVLKQINIGGAPLALHWQNAAAFQQGATNARARAWALLAAEKWDVITLQQLSTQSFQVDTYRPFAKQLHDYIKSQAPTAEVVIHETWAYREDDPLFKNGFTQGTMYWGLRTAYETIAGELGCRLIPVGEAFQNARADAAWHGVFPDPQFDYKNPQHPALPDQTHSLNMGYSWKQTKNGKPVLVLDAHHANAAGEYLAAAVWYEFLFKKSVVGNAFLPEKLSPADVAVLQRLAHQTVTEGLRLKR